MAERETTPSTEDSGLFGACTECGEPLERGVRHPATAQDGDEGTLQLFSFCDESCQAAWHARSRQ